MTLEPNARRRMQLALTSAAGLALLALAFVILNVLSNGAFVRWDMTQRQAYSLSAPSRKLVRELSDPVIVKVYFTPDLPPPYNIYERYVRDLLAEYRSASRGQVRYEFAPQSPPEEFEKKAAEAGLVPIQFEQMGSDQLQIRRGYMGLVLFHHDKSETLPIIKNVEQLEYDLTSRIAKMAQRTKKVILVTSGHGEFAWQASQSKLAADLSELYDLKDFSLPASATSQMPADALVVVGPRQKMDDKSLWAIDQLVMRGVPAAFLVDIKNIVLNQFYATPLDNGLNDLLKHYGIAVGDRYIYDAQCETIGLTQNVSGFAFTTSMRYPYIPLVDRIMNTHPVARGLDTVALPFTTTVDPVSSLSPTVHFTPLFYSSPKSWLTKAEPYVSLAPNNIPRPAPDDPHGPYSAGGMLEGTFTSYFQGKPTPKGVGELLAVSPKTQVVVLGTSKIIDPNMPSFPGEDALMSNTLAYLAKDETLLGIRSKGPLIRPLKPLPESLKRIIKIIAVLGAALLPVALGLWRWRKRQEWRAAIAASFAPHPAAV